MTRKTVVAEVSEKCEADRTCEERDAEVTSEASVAEAGSEAGKNRRVRGSRAAEARNP
jgi:hypothetical protein